MCMYMYLIMEYLGFIRALVFPGKYYKGIEDLVAFIRYLLQ